MTGTKSYGHLWEEGGPLSGEVQVTSAGNPVNTSPC